MPAHCPVCETPLPPPAFAAADRLQGSPGRFAVARCERCGAGRTLPPATPDDLAGFYPSGYGPYEARSSLPVRVISRAIQIWQGARAWRREPLDRLRDAPPGRGLDVGAGRGDLSAMLIGHGWRMTAVEPSEAACAVARTRGVDARPGTLATVALEAEAYDMAVFQHSLEHVEDPIGDLRATAAALRAGGLLIVTVPNFGCWQAVRLRSCWYHLDVPRHRTHFTAGALERAARGAGFEPVRCTTSTSGVGLVASIQYALFGRCLFPSGQGLRIASGLALGAWPVARLLDLLAGEGDQLHLVARRSTASSASAASTSAGPG